MYFLEMCKHHLITTCSVCTVSVICLSAWIYLVCCWASGFQCYSVAVSSTGYYALCENIPVFLFLLCEGVTDAIGCFIVSHASTLYFIMVKSRIFCIEVVSSVS